MGKCGRCFTLNIILHKILRKYCVRVQVISLEAFKARSRWKIGKFFCRKVVSCGDSIIHYPITAKAHIQLIMR